MKPGGIPIGGRGPCIKGGGYLIGMGERLNRYFLFCYLYR